MTPHIEETRTTHTPNRRGIACAAIFTPLGRNPANMLEEMT
jgi:hypothetical protein